MSERDAPRRAGKSRVVGWLVFVLICGFAQQSIWMLPDIDRELCGATLGDWMFAGLALLIVAATAWTLAGFFRSAARYTKLFFRVDVAVPARASPRASAVTAGACFALIVLTMILHWTVLPAVILLLRRYYGFNETLLVADLNARTALTLFAAAALIVMLATLRRLFRHLDATLPEGPA